MSIALSVLFCIDCQNLLASSCMQILKRIQKAKLFPKDPTAQEEVTTFVNSFLSAKCKGVTMADRDGKSQKHYKLL